MLVLNFSMSALNFSLGDPIFIGDIFGMILALPISLFLAFWISNVKNKAAVIGGALAGVIIAFLIILCVFGTLIHPAPFPNVNGVSTFFGSVLFCAVLGLTAGIVTDLIVAARNSRDYRRQIEHES